MSKEVLAELWDFSKSIINSFCSICDCINYYKLFMLNYSRKRATFKSSLSKRSKNRKNNTTQSVKLQDLQISFNTTKIEGTLPFAF